MGLSWTPPEDHGPGRRSGVAQALKSMVDGKALAIVKFVPDKSNGFEMWRRLWAEYRPRSAGWKVCLLESVMDDRPKEGEDFSTWYYRWAELMRQTERARKKPIDDDIKSAVALRRASPELRNQLILQTFAIAHKFHIMNEIITTWMIARRMFAVSASIATPTSKDPNAREVGAVFDKGGKGSKGKSKGKDGNSGLADRLAEQRLLLERQSRKSLQTRQRQQRLAEQGLPTEGHE